MITAALAAKTNLARAPKTNIKSTLAEPTTGAIRVRPAPIVVSSVHVTKAAPVLGGATTHATAPANNNLGGGPTASGTTSTIPGLGSLSQGLGGALQTVQSKTGLSRNWVIALGIILLAGIVWAARG